MQTPQNTKINLAASLIKGAAANLAIQAIGKSKISNLLIKFFKKNYIPIILIFIIIHSKLILIN